MGIWRAAKAQSVAKEIGIAHLDELKRWGHAAEKVFISAYHTGFLFRLLIYMTAARLSLDPNEKDVREGVMVAFDSLRKRYYSGEPQLAVSAAMSAVKDIEISSSIRSDVDLFLAATQGDSAAIQKISEVLDDDPSILDAARTVGLNVDSIPMRYYSKVFVGSL